MTAATTDRESTLTRIGYDDWRCNDCGKIASDYSLPQADACQCFTCEACGEEVDNYGDLTDGVCADCFSIGLED